MADHYNTLGVNKTASAEEIKKPNTNLKKLMKHIPPLMTKGKKIIMIATAPQTSNKDILKALVKALNKQILEIYSALSLVVVVLVKEEILSLN